MTAKQHQRKAETLLKLKDFMRIKHYAIKTEDAYQHWICSYVDWLAEHGSRLPTSEARMEAYLTALAHRGCSASTQNQAFNAIRCLYEQLLKQKLLGVDALRAKRPMRERHAPSRDDVLRMLAAARDLHGYPTVLIVKLLYGCGLRVCEPLNLRSKDVDVAHSRLFIRGSKGAKDRVVHVPCALMSEILDQMKRAKLQWEADAKARLPVELPDLIARKYKNAPFSWPWYWVFPSKSPCAHPRTGEVVRYRMHEANVQRCVRAAVKDSGIDGLISPHHLRHAYATHATDAGAHVRDVQAVLGHSSLETTMRYLHPEAQRVRSPLESITA